VSVPLLGAVEAGGTKFLCLVGHDPGDVLAEERIPTTTPAETLGRVVEFFHAAERRHGRCAAFGIASFGPLDLDPASPSWGRLTNTPKPGWAGADLVAPLRRAFDAQVAIDTDVNGAGLAEVLWGAGQDAGTLVYLTVGTGIGGGAVVGGSPLHGASHPEMGHIRVAHHPDDATFAGVCPFHGDCLEGLACGPAISARWGAPGEALADRHPAWDVLGYYLGQACVAATMLLSPHVIVIGGGVMKSPPLLPATRRWTHRLLAGYPDSPHLAGGLESYIVPPALGDRAGVLGALALARRALRAGKRSSL
jgi:fructokinase